MRRLKRCSRLRQVFDCIGRGLSNKEIAAELGITKRTVAFHTSLLMVKFDLTGPGDNRRLVVRAALGQWE